MRKIILFSSLLILVGIVLPISAQNFPEHIAAIKKAIEVKDFEKAESILQSDITTLLASKNFDSLTSYIILEGQITNGLYGAGKAIVSINKLIERLHSKNAGPFAMAEAYRQAAEFFSSIGKYKEGYDASQMALKFTMLQPGYTQLEIARCEYNLGTYAYKMGNVNLSQIHSRRAMQIRISEKEAGPEDIYLSANTMGAIMWFASKYDSASLYYRMALDALKKMPENDLNKYFRPGNIENNLAALYSAEGKTTDAIQAMHNTINDFQNFINSKDAGSKKQSATEGLYEAMDNLAGIYKEIGDYSKAGELLKYSYQRKLQKLNPDHSGIFISEILLGQYFQAVHQYDSAEHYLSLGLQKIKNADGDYLFWEADAYFTLALIAESRNDNINAADYYSKSENFYERSYQGAYDNVYMDFLRRESLFYANSNDYTKAIERANKVYDYLTKVNEGGSLQAFYQQLNIAEINYLDERYKEAIVYCDKAIGTVNAKMKDGITLLDSVKMDVFKPKAILIKAKSKYALQKNRDTVFLQQIALKLDTALNILEQRKVLIDDEANINILISEQQDLIDFAKKIELELSTSGSDTGYHLDRFINLHESALYNRIRSRLDKEDAVQFSHLPKTVLQEEKNLKNAISTSLVGSRPNSELMKGYFLALDNWQKHLAKVKKEYPEYYEMRYATIFKPLREIRSSLNDSSTVIRYIFNDSSLLALIINKNGQQLVQIDTTGLQQKISMVLLNRASEQEQLQNLNELYKIVWEPVDPFVHDKKIMIIPDGILYNFSFEMLTDKKLSSYRELATGSLLAKYIFSYHYSLLTLAHIPDKDTFADSYIAFAPGFSDEVKNKYRSAVKDTIVLDQRYLRLLPQPATNALAKGIKNILGGEIFLNELSTKNSFTTNAGGHKIIHIGTHAEYNNVHPERSGLIFAKTGIEDENNFLSLFDIYNCNMQSDLTVLTACESGRPGYQDGEGMISLAHAFNYAGSNRILTALWEIDENSSSTITEYFIQLLKKGFATDESLQRAKIKYLENATGRTLAPAYWAGLVMMGEPAAISFPTSSYSLYWILAILIFSVLMSFSVIKIYRALKATS